MEGYFATVGGKILDSVVKVGTLGLGHMSEVVFHRRLWGGSFSGMIKGGCLPGTGEWTCSNCGKTGCWSTRCSCYRCGVPRYFDGSGLEQGQFGAGPRKGEGVPGFQGQGVGAGMRGVRLVGALGRDQTCVSAVNPTHRKGSGRRGGGREEPVPGAGVGAGENRVRFQEISEDACGAEKVGLEASGVAPKGQGKTQRDLILEAVEALRTLLGQGVGTQVVDLIQEHILPPPQVTPPSSPSELERAQHLAKLLGD